MRVDGMLSANGCIQREGEGHDFVRVGQWFVMECLTVYRNDNYLWITTGLHHNYEGVPGAMIDTVRPHLDIAVVTERCVRDRDLREAFSELTKHFAIKPWEPWE